MWMGANGFEIAGPGREIFLDSQASVREGGRRRGGPVPGDQGGVADRRYFNRQLNGPNSHSAGSFAE